jgi:hypothetical protein
VKVRFAAAVLFVAACGDTATIAAPDAAGSLRFVQRPSTVLAPLHFGLGEAKPLRLTVAWMDGTSTSVGVSSRNSRLTLTPAGISCP